MNWVDIVIIIALVVPAFIGFKIGLIKLVIPLIGVLLGVVLGSVLHGYLANKLDFISSESWSHVVAFIIIFVAVFAIVYILATILQKILKLTLMGLVDRLAGAAVVFIIVWLISSFVVVMVAKYVALGADYVPGDTVSSESIKNTIEGSALATFQIDTVPIILGLLPGEFDVVKDCFED